MVTIYSKCRLLCSAAGIALTPMMGAPILSTAWALTVSQSIIGLTTTSPAEAQTASARLSADVLSLLVEVDGLSKILDGKGDLPEETIRTLDDQISLLKGERYEAITYSIDDYALSIGAIVGDGEGIIEEIDSVLALAEQRQAELQALDTRDAELAGIETAYATADLAVSDTMSVLQEYMEVAFEADAISGHPVFNNWKVLHDDIAPRFADRLAEVQRVRKDLGLRRRQLHEHLHKAQIALHGMKAHTERIIEFREAQEVSAQPSDLLKRMRERGASIEQGAELIRQGNEATRKKVNEIQQAQADAMKKADLIGKIMTVVQAGLAAYGEVSKSPSPDSTGLSIKTEETITIDYVFPKPPELLPHPPVEIPQL